ncbi:hypothetical protein OAT84_00375 [Gammaproteobacteria bacterium]|nr:hypothetical protein [Gammaproteobacteria bacterium]
MMIQVIYEVSRVLLVYTSSLLLPLAIAVWEMNLDSIWAFSVTILSGSIFAVPLFWQKNKLPQQPLLAFMILVLIWLGMIGISMVPWYLYFDLPITQCLFETTSALTTSGIEIIGQVEQWPLSFLWYRQLLCWMGGVGVVIISLSLLSVYQHSIYAHFLTDYGLELKGLGFYQRVSETAVQIAKIYATLTVFSAIGYLICGISLQYALLEAMAMISTSGFSMQVLVPDLYTTQAVKFIAIMTMFCGSVGFQCFSQVRQWHLGLPNALLYFMKYCLVCAIILMLLNPVINITDIIFLMMSFLSTTGVGDLGQLSASSALLIIMLSLIGGCVGSTSGGIKLDRLRCLWSSVVSVVENAWRPSRVLPTSVHQASLLQQSAQGYVLLFLGTLFFAIMILMTLGMAQADAISASVSALTNVGALLPSKVYLGLSTSQSIFLTFLMWIGRVELIAILVLCLPNYWRQI